jgi:hypothetical protein
MLRIDTHHHMIPPDYRDMLRRAGIDETGGRALPDWSPEGSLQTMADLGVATATSRCPRRARRSCPTPQTPPHWPATSTTTAPTWSRRRRTGSVSSPPFRCPTWTNPWPRASALSTISRPTGSCCWPTTQAPTSARTARTTCSRRSTLVRRWSLSTRPICPARQCPAWRHSRPTSSWTPRAQHTFWYAMVFAASIRTSGSS